MRKVIGIGETILDIIFKNGQPSQAVPGGSVFNGLVSLARLDVPVCFISEYGTDKVGDIIRDFMEQNRMTTDYMDSFPDGKSPVSLAFLNDQNNAEYLFYRDFPNERLEVPFPPIDEDDIFIFGSYYSLNPVIRERVVEFIEYARDRKAILYYDPNFRNAHAHEAMFLKPTILDNLEYADIVRGSDEDFRNIFGEGDIRDIYKEHVEFYCSRLITTHGANGVRLFTKTWEEHFETPAIQPVSTIGAGDNFNAGLLFGLLANDIRKKDLEQLDRQAWEKIIRCGIDLSTHVCQCNENYITPEFADTYKRDYQS